MQEHIQQLNQAIAAITSYSVHNFFFVACGGSMATLTPGQYVMEQESDYPAFVYSSNEFIHRNPHSLGKGSVVILCSTSGNTPETVRAASFAREKGALTVAFSHLVDSPLWQAAEYRIHYSTGDEAACSEYSNAMLYRLLFGILQVWNPQPRYTELLEAIMTVYPENLRQTLAARADWAKELGKKYKREDIIYTMGSGICYPVAYSFAICILMEMQWIHSHALHTGEFFHGPFEITDDNVPMILIKSIGDTRPLDERAEAFTKKFTDKLIVVDAETFIMDGIPVESRKYFAPLFVAPVLRNFANELGAQRGHPLSVRRYMWKMDY